MDPRADLSARKESFDLCGGVVDLCMTNSPTPLAVFFQGFSLDKPWSPLSKFSTTIETCETCDITHVYSSAAISIRTAW